MHIYNNYTLGLRMRSLYYVLTYIMKTVNSEILKRYLKTNRMKPAYEREEHTCRSG